MSKRGKRGEPGTFGPDVYDADSPDAKDRAAGGWGLGRRDFLKASGFFVAGASLGCARGPAPEAIALLEASPEMVPGRSSWYASTCGACSAACGVLVRSRDGRPLKLEGNPLHGLSRGGLCAVGQASLLELYDSQRLRRPLWRGGETTWEELDAEISRGLAGAAAKGLPVRLLTETMHSPSELAAIARFGEAFDDFRHVVYDPLSVSAILDAHAATHGRRVLPRYRFEAADVLVSFDADFLSTWISPVEFTAGYSAARDLSGEPPHMSYHLQIESRLSLTGSNADERRVIHPAEMSSWMRHLAAVLAARSGRGAEGAFPPVGQTPGAVAAVAERLWAAQGRSLVVCGSQDLGNQILCNRINHLLGNYGPCLDLERPSQQKQGDDGALADLRRELAEGRVEVLLVRTVNPLFDLPGGGELAAEIGRVPFSVSFARSMDETAGATTAVCPEPHFLEDWRDAEPVPGKLSLTQPLVRPLGATRGFARSLLTWSGDPKEELEWLRQVWRRRIFPLAAAGAAAVEDPPPPASPGPGSREPAFRKFWDRALHDGYVEVPPPPREPAAFDPAALEAAEGEAIGDPRREAFILVLYPKAGMLDGRHAHNAWLQELPDPVTKVSWDNYACLSPGTAAKLGLGEGDLVRITGPGEGRDLVLPAFLQPGQHDAVVAVARGYGRSGTDRFAGIAPSWLGGEPTVEAGGTVGIRAEDWLDRRHERLESIIQGVEVAAAGGRRRLAVSQVYDDLEVPEKLRPADGHPRPIIQQASLAAYTADRGAGRPHGHFPQADLWPEPPPGKHHWGMAIDLTACTGCSACVLACQVENNVPVVGRDEVRRRRDLYWLRIDRYYSHEGGDLEVAHQPMLCHHCDNAPCETVCPVLATVHSDEGLNQQVYNRCVGTRYCANNCPFKVRRFNWFDYPRDDATANLALNPDVTVRSRGVMEKCSFCVQRIQEAKIAARGRGEELAVDAVRTACQQSCPAGAIAFGDLLDPGSEIARTVADPRHYRLFEELNIQPSVGYLRLVRNRPEEEKGHVDPHA